MAATDEQPLGKRKSNKPKAFQPTYGSFSKSGTAAEIENPIGDGDAFESIPVIKQRLGALKDDAPELKFLHSVIFRNEGDAKSRKEKLLAFKGLKGGSSASTDAMRVRAHKTLLEPSNKNMVPALIHLLGLVEHKSATISRSISQIVQFLGSPSLKNCVDVESEADVGKVANAQSRAKAAAPRKNAKKAREAISDADEEPVQKRQRGARTGKQKPAPKKPAEAKAAKRKASEVEIEVAPETEEAAEADNIPVEEPKVAEVHEQGDEEMQVSPEQSLQEEADNVQEDDHENDPEPAANPAMYHVGPPAIEVAPQQPAVPAASDQPDPDAALDRIDSQDGEEPEPPPPGLENVHEQMEHVQPVCGPEVPPQPEAPPVVLPSQRPPIGSQASPCDAAKPGSHGRSQPPQLGPHALQPPLERVGTSDGHAVVSHDNGSVTKVGRARGTSKKPAARVPVAAPIGTSKKAAPNSRRGAQAVAAANQVPAVVQQLSGMKKQSKVQPSSDVKKLLLQAEKHQKALAALHETVQNTMEGHAAHLDALRKFASATTS